MGSRSPATLPTDGIGDGPLCLLGSCRAWHHIGAPLTLQAAPVPLHMPAAMLHFVDPQRSQHSMMVMTSGSHGSGSGSGATLHPCSQVEGIYRSLGQPHPFQLRYTLIIEAAPVQPPPLNDPCALPYQQWQHHVPLENQTWLPPAEQRAVEVASAAGQQAPLTGWAPIPECQWAPSGTLLHRDVPAHSSVATHSCNATMMPPQHVLQPGAPPPAIAGTAPAQYSTGAAGMIDASVHWLPPPDGQDPTPAYQQPPIQVETHAPCTNQKQSLHSEGTTLAVWGNSVGGQPGVPKPSFPTASAPARQHTQRPHTQLLLPDPDDYSLSFLLQSEKSMPPPPLSTTAAASQLPAPTGDSLMMDHAHSIYDGGCSLNAFSASLGGQSMQVAPMGACQRCGSNLALFVEAQACFLVYRDRVTPHYHPCGTVAPLISP